MLLEVIVKCFIASAAMLLPILLLLVLQILLLLQVLLLLLLPLQRLLLLLQLLLLLRSIRKSKCRYNVQKEEYAFKLSLFAKALICHKTVKFLKTNKTTNKL